MFILLAIVALRLVNYINLEIKDEAKHLKQEVHTLKNYKESHNSLNKHIFDTIISTYKQLNKLLCPVDVMKTNGCLIPTLEAFQQSDN